LTARGVGPILISVHPSRKRSALVLAIGLCIAWIAVSAAAEGEPDGAFPSWEERWMHELINRARCDPQVEMDACGSACAEAACYAPTHPLTWTAQLNRAARFHSANLTESGCGISHSSPCTLVANIGGLYPETCDGAVSCACVGGTASCTGTDVWSRIALFGTTGNGENIAGSSTDPTVPFYNWLFEPTSSSTCGFHTNADNGHRFNILADQSWVTSVGTGQSGAWVTSDFGAGSTPGKIPSGSHHPQQAAIIEAWANWYDNTGPAAAAVNVDGTCHPMSLERGSATNGAWTAVVTDVGSGCHRYYFEFQDSLGAVVTYPTTGSLAVGSGTGCPDWSASRPDSCLAATAPIFTDGFESGNTGFWSATVP